MRTPSNIRFKPNQHLLSKILILLSLLFGPLQVFSTPLPQVMGQSDKAFGVEGHPYILFSPERVAKLRARLENQEAGALSFKNLVDNQTNGANYYAFENQFVAFMYPILGEDKYCTFAVARDSLL